MGVHIQPSPMPYQASKEGGRSRHGRTLRNGIAGPAAVVHARHATDPRRPGVKIRPPEAGSNAMVVSRC